MPELSRLSRLSGGLEEQRKNVSFFHFFDPRRRRSFRFSYAYEYGVSCDTLKRIVQIRGDMGLININVLQRRSPMTTTEKSEFVSHILYIQILLSTSIHIRHKGAP